jgi:predicted lipoprotein with Yx(FWY)xxD motif
MMIRTTRTSLLGVITVVAFALSLVVISSSLAQQAVPGPLKTATKEGLDTFLVDANGMTLYIFDNDKEPGKSTCSGGCARAWPPYGPKAGDPAPAAPLSIITRDDGSKQYGYKGKPLYYFKKDKKPGDTTGQGAGDRWWVVKP